MSINAVMGIFGNHFIFSNPPTADDAADGTSTTTTTLEQDMMDDWRGERIRGDGRIGPSLPAYGRAKLCGILFAFELNYRMKGRGVIAHAVHSTGAVVTDSSRGSILAAFPFWIPGLRWMIAQFYFPMLWRSVEGGACSLLCPTLSQTPYIRQGGQYLDALCQPFLHDLDPDLSRRQQFTLPLKEEPRTIQMDPVQALLLVDIKWSERLWNVSIAFLQDSPGRPIVAGGFAPRLSNG